VAIDGFSGSGFSGSGGSAVQLLELEAEDEEEEEEPDATDISGINEYMVCVAGLADRRGLTESVDWVLGPAPDFADTNTYGWLN